MIAYKGVSPDGSNRLGQGKIVYKVGEVYKTDKSKTVNSGFHCCENPFECLTYYTLGEDRFLMVEADGSIDEDENERIACTKLKVLRELSIVSFMLSGMTYIIEHSNREKWEQHHKGVTVAENKAQNKLIAIARGVDPVASAEEGGYIGVIIEEPADSSIIRKACAHKVDGKEILPGVLYHWNFNVGGWEAAE